MNPLQVKQRVEKIEARKDDRELAYATEAALYFDLLTAIALGDCRLPRECAREAVKSKEIKFGPQE